MKNKVAIYQVDAFTKELYKGNPAGVVINADGLSELQMQLIARELNNSETSFLFSPDNNTCDGIIRYFTPKTEVPTCGHATIAAMYVKAVEENLDSSVFNYKTKIGVLPFKIIKNNDDYKIVMTQGKVEFCEPFEQNIKEKIINSLSLTLDDLDERSPVQIVSTGHSKVLVGIKSRKKLNEIKPDLPELEKLSKVINCNGYFVFTFDSDLSNILTYGRMFAPAIGIAEDPVTGNANGPLGAYIVHHKLVKIIGNEFTFIGRQGEAINRLGEVEVIVKIENEQPVQVQVAGNAVIVFNTEIKI